MDNQLWLKFAFDRRANAMAVLVVLGTAWLYLPFYIFLCAVLALIIFLVVGVRPNARRNRNAWNDMFPRQGAERVQFVAGGSGAAHHFREWRLPLIVIVHSEADFSITRSLPYWNHEAFDNASICVSLPSRVLPLARYVLWRLGGILPASRAVLLRLLGQRSVGDSSEEAGGAGAGSGSASSPPRRASGSEIPTSPATMAATGVVVAFYDGSKLVVKEDSDSKKKIVDSQISSKSVISAALKTGAHVAAAVQLPEGTIFVGKPQQLLVSELNNSSNKSEGAAAAAAAPAAAAASSNVIIENPSVEQVLAASEEYCALLSSVLQKAYPGMEPKVVR